MEIVSKTGDPDLAEVYVAKFRERDELLAEFVDVRDPALPMDEKWVIIISTQFGCPIACPMCDSGGDYRGDITADEMFAQIDHVISQHDPGRLAMTKKFKIQFARMGDPALNPAVLDVLEELPKRYDAPGLIPCIATIAPAQSRGWFDKLIEIRHSVYRGRPFQLQLSINSTDENLRDLLMPVPKMGLVDLAQYAHRFCNGAPRKVSLNFALAEGVPVDPFAISKYFDPKFCCIKITPLNPTAASEASGLKTALPPDAPHKADALREELYGLGFDVILSIGDVRENQIGSNCGMAIKKARSITTGLP